MLAYSDVGIPDVELAIGMWSGVALSIFSVVALDYFANTISAALLLFTINCASGELPNILKSPKSK